MVSSRGVEGVDDAFRAAFDDAPIGMTLVALDGGFVLVNRSTCRITGYREDELLTKTYQDITHPDDLEVDVAYASAVRDGEIPGYSMEKRYIRADGSAVWVNLSVSLVRDADGEPAYLISQIEDIDDRKRAEAQIREYAARLEQSNRELSEFAYVASHDLRAPLNAITGFRDLLFRRYADVIPPEAMEYVDLIGDAVDRMGVLIDALLAFARMDADARPFDDVDCGDVVAEVVTDLQPALEASGGRVEVADLPVVWGERAMLVRLFQNLVANAVKFHGEHPPAIRISAAPEGAWWRFSVADNGIGIPAEQAERVFAMFQRLHPRNVYPGTGLGLSACRKVVEHHGGRIWVEKNHHPGTMISFLLPEVEAPRP